MRLAPILVLFAFLLSFQPAALSATEATPSASPPAPVLISAARIEALRARVATRTEPTASAWKQVLAAADAALDQQPTLPADGHWRVPGFYQDAAGHRAAKEGLLRDANAAYALALAHRITGEPRYAVAAARLILAWTTVRRHALEADAPLVFSYHYPAMIFAADLLRTSPAPVWTPDHEARMQGYVALILSQARRSRWRVWQVDNNWGNWGVVLGLAAAAYANDQEVFDAQVARWKHLIEIAVAEDGHLPKEVHRNRATPGTHGLWYSHFSLQPAAIGAEIARVHAGLDLYNHVSPSGRGLRLAYDRLVPWVADLNSFPYFRERDKSRLHAPYAIAYWELFETRWPRPDARALIVERRPHNSPHSMPHSTFTHGDLPADL